MSTADPTQAPIPPRVPPQGSEPAIAGAPPAGSIRWLPATVVSARMETAGSRTLHLSAPGFLPTVAGQHLDVRLTAPDGYTAQRSYSIGSPAAAGQLELTVDLMAMGEVSPYLVEAVEVGDMFEVRGPIGQWFVWRPEQTGSVQLIAGGSGIVPIMAMIRTHAQIGSAATFRLLYSVRSPDVEFYRDELDALERSSAGALVVERIYTRTAPLGHPHRVGRIDQAIIQQLSLPPSSADGPAPTVYVCGPTPFVEVVANALVGIGHAPENVRTERFGPTG
ncbi:FAD-binding oxidoreductase [Naasia lichenicola]|uniref:Oxidoreductase n=1 Tax=Naasia lichenicola TaxID=2565933 RepID=A0A4S4FQB0_9MICO|nr:FAD-binding oxidoreductase [Naasia lichenicola]THG31795.1 oxidoreductase [Naasia lichenicola]